MKKLMIIIMVILDGCLLVSCQESTENMVKRLENEYHSLRYDNSIKIANKIIEIDPDNAKAYYLRGSAYKAQKLVANDYDPLSFNDYLQTVGDYSVAIRLDPDNAQYIFSRAEIEEKLSQYEEAIEDYSKALVLDPSFVKKVFTGFFGKQSPVQLIAYYTNLIENNEASSVDYGNMTQCYGIIGDFDNALEKSSKAIELDPNSARAYLVRGDVYWSIGEFSSAVNDYKKGRRIEPDLDYQSMESQYEEIDIYDFVVKYGGYKAVGQNIKRFKIVVRYSHNDGPKYYFDSFEGDTYLALYSPKRLNNLTRRKKVNVYFRYNPTVDYSNAEQMYTIEAVVF
ncbi:hypothetical protein AGMMS49940_23850 [Spirochaetia bacterium]|nr:hypothetical protein AGMMS49940_23850 [Spirochaetia bacterium]